MKRISVMLILILISGIVSGNQDSFISIKASNINLCLSEYQNLTDYKCNGNVLQLEGTQDHLIYILPYTDLPKNITNYNSTFHYYLNKPIVWLGLLFSGFIIPMMFALIIAIGIIIILKNIIPKR